MECNYCYSALIRTHVGLVGGVLTFCHMYVVLARFGVSFLRFLILNDLLLEPLQSSARRLQRSLQFQHTRLVLRILKVNVSSLHFDAISYSLELQSRLTFAFTRSTSNSTLALRYFHTSLRFLETLPRSAARFIISS